MSSLFISRERNMSRRRAVEDPGFKFTGDPVASMCICRECRRGNCECGSSCNCGSGGNCECGSSCNCGSGCGGYKISNPPGPRPPMASMYIRQCCGGNCECGSSCKCGSGCGGYTYRCKMYPDFSFYGKSSSKTQIVGAVPQKGHFEGFEATARALRMKAADVDRAATVIRATANEWVPRAKVSM